MSGGVLARLIRSQLYLPDINCILERDRPCTVAYRMWTSETLGPGREEATIADFQVAAFRLQVIFWVVQ